MEIKAIVSIDIDETNPKLCGKCGYKKGVNCWLYKELNLKEDKETAYFKLKREGGYHFRTAQCLVNK